MRFILVTWLFASTALGQSVYQLNPAVDLAVGGVAGLGIVVPYALSDTLIHPRCPCSPSEVPSFDRGAIGNHDGTLDAASDATVGVLIMAPVLVDGLVLGWNRPLLEDTAVFAQTLLVNGALVTAAKYIVQRPLPRTYAGDPELIDSPDGYRSFYSGHTSTAAAALGVVAMTLNYRYDQKVWPWFAAAGIEALIGYERVRAGRHFPSDVAVGALMGTAVGIVVPWLHQRHSPVSISAAPLDGGAVASLTLRW